MPFPSMKVPSTSPARIKNLLHGLQGFLIFLAWVLTIAVFTKSGGIDGRSGWFFGVVRDLFCSLWSMNTGHVLIALHYYKY